MIPSRGYFFISIILQIFILLKQNEAALIPESTFQNHSESETGRQNRAHGAQVLTLDPVESTKQLIPPNYNNLSPPLPINGKPTKVGVSVILMNIRAVNEELEQITVEMNLRMSWKDSRLRPLDNLTGTDSFVVLSPNLLEKIWHPDTFVDHSISVKMPAITRAPASLRIYADSVVRYSARLTVTVACEMDFHLYPMDTQSCPLELMSYAYPANVMELEWEHSHGNGASFARPLSIPNFRIDMGPVKTLHTETNSATYTNLQFGILLGRSVKYQLINTYFPSAILLAISWITYLIPKRSAPERITVCSLTMLTLIVMLGDLETPKVSYMTALHLWMFFCVLFVFLSFIEFVLVIKFRGLSAGEKDSSRKTKTNLKTKKQKKAKSLKTAKKNSYTFKDGHKNSDGETEESSRESIDTPPGHKSGEVEKGDKYLRMARRMDKVTAISLPILFILFNIFYWSWLILSSKAPALS